MNKSKCYIVDISENAKGFEGNRAVESCIDKGCKNDYEDESENAVNYLKSRITALKASYHIILSAKLSNKSAFINSMKSKSGDNEENVDSDLKRSKSEDCITHGIVETGEIFIRVSSINGVFVFQERLWASPEKRNYW